MPIFVTFQSSVSWWQLCYPSILSLPPPPHLLELRRKPSAELAFRRFFFLNTNFPLFRSNPQSGLVSAGFDERLVLCFVLPEERLPPLAFLFDSIPCHSAGQSEVAAATVSCRWGAPFFQRLHGDALAGEGGNQNQKKNIRK